MQTNWHTISARLMAALANSKESTEAIANGSGANYYAIRRYRIHGIKNQTENALKLCAYFSIETAQNANRTLDFDDIIHAAKTAWDGTHNHAELLVSLIESTKSFKLKKR